MSHEREKDREKLVITKGKGGDGWNRARERVEVEKNVVMLGREAAKKTLSLFLFVVFIK